MKSLLALLALLASIQRSTVLGQPRIVGGQNAVSGEFPWVAAIWLDGTQFCGGSLISTSWVLTAAHCAVDHLSFEIIMGALILLKKDEPGRQVRTTTKKIIHQKYSPTENINDIALLGVATPFVLSDQVKVVRLPRGRNPSYDLQTATVVGWGATTSEGTVQSNILKKLVTRVISNKDCAPFYPAGVVQSTHMCISTTKTDKVCRGDSGGPVTVVESDGVATQVGIVSFGLVNCSDDHPEALTRLSSFTTWIGGNTGIMG